MNSGVGVFTLKRQSINLVSCEKIVWLGFSSCSGITTSRGSEPRKLDSVKEEEVKQQDRMEFLEMIIKRIISAGRMDAHSWWVSELPAIDCAMVWLKLEAEELMNKWLGWLQKEMQKKGEKKGDLEGYRRLVGNIIASAEGCTGFLHKVTHTKASS